ncbi:hypothetical protein [Dictyobacter vulcani]|uniref:hypothetical protein n=1 Tax=Dictyobacter vulcani TaxID=2607529 RepID=UPI001E596BD5|nr:hypothetical protein [Dictyobacter vulcani]
MTQLVAVVFFLLDHTTDAYDPTALRASMGAIFSQRLVKTSFQAFADWKRLYHYPVIGASDAAVVELPAGRLSIAHDPLDGQRTPGTFTRATDFVRPHRRVFRCVEQRFTQRFYCPTAPPLCSMRSFIVRGG